MVGDSVLFVGVGLTTVKQSLMFAQGSPLVDDYGKNFCPLSFVRIVWFPFVLMILCDSYSF